MLGKRGPSKMNSNKNSLLGDSHKGIIGRMSSGFVGTVEYLGYLKYFEDSGIFEIFSCT